MTTHSHIENGTAVIEDHSIGVRVTLQPDGLGSAESMRASWESVLLQHADRVEHMIEEARLLLSSRS